MSTRKYPVVWIDKPNNSTAFRQGETFGPLVSMLDGLAKEFNREFFADALIPLSPGDVRVPLTGDAAGHVLTSDRRSVVIALDLQRALRKYERHAAAVLVRQKNLPNDEGIVRRTIVLHRTLQTSRAIVQLRALQRGIGEGSAYRHEAAWLGLTEEAHKYLKVGFEIARRRGELEGFNEPLEVDCELVPGVMPSRQLLDRILRHAICAASRPGNRPLGQRDEALAAVLAAFVCLSGRSGTGARLGGVNEPAGRGAKLVRDVEELFKINLLAKNSTHAIGRALHQPHGVHAVAQRWGV